MEELKLNNDAPLLRNPEYEGTVLKLPFWKWGLSLIFLFY